MPIYEYRCENGHSIEVTQHMSDAPLTECTVCGAPVQRVFHPVAVHFKGKGFYATDYGKANAGPADGKGDAGSDAKPAKSGSDSKGGSDSGSSSSSNDDGSKKSTKSAAAES